MPALTEAAIRELASIKAALPLSRRVISTSTVAAFVRRQDLEHEVETLLRDAKHRFDGDESVQSDLRKIEQLVRRGIDRSQVRGLAIFACSAEGLWEVIELPGAGQQPRPRQPVPAVGQLEAVLREHEPIGVLMADRQRARMFVFEMGRLVERSELFDGQDRETDKGERDRGVDPAQSQAARPRPTCATPPTSPSTCGRSGRSSTWPSPRPTTWPPSSRPACTPTCAAACPAA